MKALLDQVLDVVIPEGEGFPSARSLDLGTALLSGPAKEPVEGLLGQLPGDFSTLSGPVRISLLEALERRRPETFATFLLEIYRAYYRAPAVVGVIEDLTGYAARPPQPLGYALPPFDEAMLAVPMRRPAHYRRP